MPDVLRHDESIWIDSPHPVTSPMVGLDVAATQQKAARFFECLDWRPAPA
jgi:hypothetical protein